MNKRYVTITALICIISIAFVYLGFSITKQWQTNRFSTKNKVLPVVKSSTIVTTALDRPTNIDVEIEVYDDPLYPVSEVQIDGTSLPLRTKGPTNDRGFVYLKLSEGKHTLRWRVALHQSKWPQFSEQTKTFDIKKGSTKIHILIEGKNVTIS